MPQASPEPPPNDATEFAVLLFTDIVDSTKLKALHGPLEYKRAAELHNALFERLAAEENLTLVDSAGDGYFARGGSVARAVRFALRFQAGMRSMTWPSFKLTTRLGIHAGEVTDITSLGRKTVLAPAADLASRVMSLGLGGQILLTKWPFDEARHFVRAHPAIEDRELPGLIWLAHGPYLFKGCDEPIEVFEVGAANLAPLAAPPNSEKAKRAIRPGDEETLGWRPAKGLEIPGRAGWQLAEKLGAGGFGEVWAGEHDTTYERRAYKFCFDAERLRALKREVTLTRLLKHELGERDDIVRIYDLRLDEPPYFLETELASDGNLLQWAEKQGGLAAIALSTRIELVAASAEALAAAHSAGVLHKDVKPTNVLIFTAKNGAPRPRLVDFGIGTLADPNVLAQHGITGAGFTGARTIQHSTGTPTYSPPEYLAGKPYTVQGDVFALGVMLYQLVTADGGRPLAEGWQRDVPDELLRIDIAACVDGDPARRLPSAKELATRLRSLDARAAEAQRLAAAEAARRTRKRRRRVLAVVAVTAILIAGVGVPLAFWALREKATADAISAVSASREGKISDALALVARSISYDRNNEEARAPLGNLLTYYNHPIQVARLEHIQALQFINDGRRIITLSDDKLSRIWDADSGKPVTEPIKYDYDGSVEFAEFSPDGARLLTQSWRSISDTMRESEVRLWDTQTGHPLGEPMKQNILFQSGNFSPDGRHFVTLYLYAKPGDSLLSFSEVQVWDAQTAHPLGEPMKYDAAVDSADFSRDGRRIVIVVNPEHPLPSMVQVCDAQSGKPLTEYKYDTSVSARFGADETRIVISSQDQPLQIWDYTTGKAPIDWIEYGGPIRFAEFSQDGRRIATLSQDSLDGTVRVWDRQTGDQLGEPIKTELVNVDSATFSLDGKRIVTRQSGSGGGVQVWDVTTGRAVTELMPTGEWALDSATLSLDGKRVLTFARGGHLACLWDVQNGNALAEPIRNAAKINAARFSPDGKLIVTVSDDGTARVWDAQSSKPLTEPMKHDHPVRDANFSPDSKRILTISKDNTVRVWDAESGKALSPGIKHEGFIDSARFSTDNKQIVTTGRASVGIFGHTWDAATGRPVAGPTPDYQRESELYLNSNRFVSPDGKRKLEFSDNAVAVIDDSPFWPFWKRGSNAGRSIPEFWGRIPAWLPRLAQAIAGERLKWRDAFPLRDMGKQVDQNADVIRQIKDQLNREPANDDWAIWGKWFFADRSTRTISPFSKITLPEYIENRIKENTAESLDVAEQLAIGNPELLQRIQKARESGPNLENETPTRATEQSATPKANPAKSQTPEALSETESNSARRFDGTWQRTRSGKSPLGNSFKDVATITIVDGKKAQWTQEVTGVLAPGNTWDDFPKPYNTVSPTSAKYTSESTDFRIEGSILIVHWPAEQLADWAPKKVPAGLFKTNPQSAIVTYTLDGNQMISNNGKTKTVWQRVR